MSLPDASSNNKICRPRNAEPVRPLQLGCDQAHTAPCGTLRAEHSKICSEGLGATMPATARTRAGARQSTELEEDCFNACQGNFEICINILTICYITGHINYKLNTSKTRPK